MKAIFLTLSIILVLFKGNITHASGLKYGIWDASPYSFKKDDKYTGIDLDIFAELLKEAGLPAADFSSAPTTWSSVLDAIKNGNLAVVGAATETDERKVWGIFSKSYRNEEHVAVTPSATPVSFSDSDTFIDYVQKNGVKVGIVKGIIYNSTKIMDFLKVTPPSSVAFIPFDSYEAALEGLMSGAVNIALVESVNTSFLLKQKNQTSNYKLTNIGASAPQHFIFSKKNVSQDVIDKINDAISKSSAKIQEIINRYTKN